MASSANTCRFWLRGDCKYGDGCRFLHESTSASIEQSLNRDRRRNNKLRAMIKDGVGIACSIELSELGKGYDDPVRLTNYRFLASYNWLEVEEPTIYVPGCPPLWKLPSLPIKLPKDSSTITKDTITPRSPKHSFEPLFKSLLVMQPNFDMATISLVTNRNNFRNLFNFACNNSGRSFRIDVDIVYNTMFLTRWEQSHVQLVHGEGNSGYGHEFEKAFTKFDENLANSAAHHRIVQYNLGGMNCLVRFKADAYIDDYPSSDNLELTDIDNNIYTTLQSLSLEEQEKDAKSAPQSEVRSIQSGRLVPPASVIEIKSRNQKFKMEHVIPQLWFSQTEHLLVGYHRQGLIEEEPERYEMESYFKDWEIQHEEQLRKFMSLILRIREAVQETEGKRGAIIYSHVEKPTKLRIVKTAKDGLMALLDDEKKCWKNESS